jgi:geranylgeranyl pyrophosphate synthase
MIETQLAQGFAAVETTLHTVIGSDVPTLADASLHIVSSGGKRIRPRVVMLAYLAAGGTQISDVTTLASAVELVHTATLVHDDINDHSAMRRGKVSVHARWGRTFALLTGDFMFAKVYQMMSPYGATINHLFASAAVTLVEGETLQAVAAKAGRMDRETYKEVIERKTAVLFKAGAEMAALVAGADPAVAAALRDYGNWLGMTFQIVDDILDLVGNPEEMGKPTGLDVAQNRGVLAVSGGANGAATAVAEEVVAEEDDPIERLLRQLRSSGAADVARLEAERTGQRALDALEAVPPSPARDALAALVHDILERQK